MEAARQPIKVRDHQTYYYSIQAVVVFRPGLSQHYSHKIISFVFITRPCVIVSAVRHRTARFRLLQMMTEAYHIIYKYKLMSNRFTEMDAHRFISAGRDRRRKSRYRRCQL